MRRISVSASLLVVVASCGRHQPAPASVPVPLVSALIDDRGSPTRGTPTYSVGHVPPGFPAVLTPQGPITIVGGMTAGDETVAVFADSTRRLAAVMEQLFEQHGYTRPTPTPGSGFSSGSGPYSSFCGDSGTVSVEPLAGANRTFVRVTYRQVRGRSQCGFHQPPPTADQLSVPELKPPAGVRVGGSHGSAGSSEVISVAEITGADLRAPAIIAYYAAQLTAAGWASDAPMVGQRATAQYFAAKDASGKSWEGVLVAVGGNTALTVSLTMYPRASR